VIEIQMKINDGLELLEMLKLTLCVGELGVRKASGEVR
jgi:hypothetical protein